jgi:hypothetical protein
MVKECVAAVGALNYIVGGVEEGERGLEGLGLLSTRLGLAERGGVEAVRR